MYRSEISQKAKILLATVNATIDLQPYFKYYILKPHKTFYKIGYNLLFFRYVLRIEKY